MCGIFGRFSIQNGIPDFAPLLDATNLLAHRGPDDGTWWSDGPFFLGHRRLSIIDLESGQQPMATADHRYVIVFNGEIYNYLELRQELAETGVTFTTASDTEVILQGYRVWGSGLPERLLGMFAFAIADRREGSLFLARDRFGEKPLFVYEGAEAVYFASEVRALDSLPDFERAVDLQALKGYLCLNYVPGDQTLLRDVRRLPPGSWRSYRGEGSHSGQYWSVRSTVAGLPAPSPAEALEEVRGIVDRSVHMALRSDVPVALLLSGGIDSSIIAESAVRQGRLQHAYCLDFPEAGFSEMPNATRVAEKLGIELRPVVLSTEALQDFSNLVAHADDPLADSSAVAVWALAKEVAKDYKVVITGDGGDELFGGYLTYKATALHANLSSLLPRQWRSYLRRLAPLLPVGDGKVPFSYKLMRFLRAADLPSSEAHFSWNGSWLPEDAARLLKDTSSREMRRTVLRDLAERSLNSARPSIADLQRADIEEYLANDILAKVDRMTMAHGLESRAPFLMPDTAALGLRLPANLKVTLLGKPKRLLRTLAERIYGREISAARKQGFSIPVHRWLRGPMRETVEDLLSPDALRTLGFIDSSAVAEVKRLHMENKAQLGFELWGLMVLVAWHRMRIVERPLPERKRASLRRIHYDLDRAVVGWQ